MARIEAVPSGLEHINPKTVFGFAFPEELLLEQTRSDMNRRQLARYNFAADASPPPPSTAKTFRALLCLLTDSPMASGGAKVRKHSLTLFDPPPEGKRLDMNGLLSPSKSNLLDSFFCFFWAAAGCI